jgi:hypothetical protein
MKKFLRSLVLGAFGAFLWLFPGKWSDRIFVRKEST